MMDARRTGSPAAGALTRDQSRDLSRLLHEQEVALRGLLRGCLDESAEAGWLADGDAAAAPGDAVSAPGHGRIDTSLPPDVSVRLRAIADARARLRERTYGICVACGAAISFDRLLASPTARHCLACQERLEHRAAAAGHRLH